LYLGLKLLAIYMFTLRASLVRSFATLSSVWRKELLRCWASAGGANTWCLANERTRLV